jgi:hypothetical protein
MKSSRKRKGARYTDTFIRFHSTSPNSEPSAPQGLHITNDFGQPKSLFSFLGGGRPVSQVTQRNHFQRSATKISSIGPQPQAISVDVNHRTDLITRLLTKAYKIVKPRHAPFSWVYACQRRLKASALGHAFKFLGTSIFWPLCFEYELPCSSGHR